MLLLLITIFAYLASPYLGRGCWRVSPVGIIQIVAQNYIWLTARNSPTPARTKLASYLSSPLPLFKFRACASPPE